MHLLLVAALLAPDLVARTITRAPLGRTVVWGPPAGTASLDAVLLLHGNQLHAPDPNWMTSLRFVPGFEQRVLIVPSLPDGEYDWARPDVVRALAGLLRDWPARRVFLVGYSAGGSRVFDVARGSRFAGIVSIAGDVLRSSARLPPTRLLLVCMTGDDGPHTSCGRNEANRRRLLKRGFAVTLERASGNHNLDWSHVGPILDRWLNER